jgi:hypothetical protein
MDARPILEMLARVFAKHGLEVILIGNAAAALRGAPVTTIDVDFLFRKTPRNIVKLKAIAGELDAVILKPFYPVSGLMRLSRDSDGLQVDFMSQIHGAKSFESLRSQSEAIDLNGQSLLVATLGAVISSKEAAGRPRDLAVLDILKKSLHETEESKSKKATRRTQEGK